MDLKSLIAKYNVPVPRYTSYPTVPYWDAELFNTADWLSAVKRSFKESNRSSGISLYIHLPFCESLCTYCACNTRITKNHAVELPYLETVLKEWKLYQDVLQEQPLIKELHLGGGTPTFFSPENLRLLVSGILENCDLHPDAEFSFEAHPGNTTVAHLQTLYDLGFRRLSLGIQDFDLKVQKIINRMQSVEEVETVSAAAKSIGYTSINHDLIYGLPLQTLAGLKETISKVIQLKPERIAYYSYAHVPWVKPGQRMFTELDLPSGEEKLELYEEGKKMLRQAGYEEIGMDHFALKQDSLFHAHENGTLHRNFMGYTHQYTQLMIGLGVSSISDTWYAFAQNEKKVEAYIKRVNQGELPLIKGHLLTPEDLLMRKHILNIMCKGSTTYNKEALAVAAFKNALGGLEGLKEDGLVKHEGNTLVVRPAGKRFLRNICAVFDARMASKKPEQQIFSLST
jgi:oxygen-independent coproporphyrinogen-3 oxidase